MFKISTCGYFGSSRVGFIHCLMDDAGLSMDCIIADFLREHDECSMIHVGIIEKVS